MCDSFWLSLPSSIHGSTSYNHSFTMSRSRSRSRSHAPRDDGPALRPIADNRWGRAGPNPDHPHEPSRNLVWNSTPALRHIRWALILVDLQQVRQVMEEQVSDAMTVTRILPDFQDSEELAMFTYARLLSPVHLQATTAGALLSGISQYIFHTWGVNIDPDYLDLRWTDATGDVFALRNYLTVSRLLQENHPNWTRAQDVGILSSPTTFTSPNQPYIMRMSCHKALPPNYFP